MERSKVTVATITCARSVHEEELLRQSLTRLANSKLHVAVADAGSRAAFTAFLASLPGFSVTVPREAGLVGQVQASVAAAARCATPFILYTEPDKDAFFGGPLDDFLEQADAAHDGVVIASRSDESFSTFPSMQRYTEGVVNHLCAELIGRSGDYTYGPFLTNRALAPFIADVPTDLGWGWRLSVFLAARRRGLRVAHVTGNYPCPHDQRQEDDGDRVYRLRQLSQNIAGLAT